MSAWIKLLVVLSAIVEIAASCVPETAKTPPDAQLPSAYRGEASTQTSLGDESWRQLYQDSVLQNLIAQALVKNFNVELAYDNILQAQASLGIANADESVFVNGIIQAPYQATTGNKNPNWPSTVFQPAAGVEATYQIDLFGKLASATGVARDQLLSTEAAKDTVLATVVAQVAGAYFQLRELDEVLAYTQTAVIDRQEGVRLAKIRVEGGYASMQDQRQAEQSLYEVTQNVPALRESIAQTENALSVLTGDYPHSILRGQSLVAQVRMPAVPPTGVASQLLQRRPDIQESEYAIAAAGGDVDVARKLLYPSLTLGATAAVGGTEETGAFANVPAALASLSKVDGVFYGPLGLFSILPQLLQPIFNGGKIRSQIHLAEAQQQAAAISYLQTVHRAFQEVSDNVVAYDESGLRTAQLQHYLDASVDSVRLAQERYDNGYTSYLEVLDAQSRAYNAHIDVSQGELNQRLALVRLYLALGGGWQSAQ
jgi:outer membrane protein, multidrug efflux system